MFIRSQDGMLIVDATLKDISPVIHNVYDEEDSKYLKVRCDGMMVVVGKCNVGVYKSLDEAKEVMDMIWSAMCQGTKFFQMPQSEVIE